MPRAKGLLDDFTHPAGTYGPSTFANGEAHGRLHGDRGDEFHFQVDVVTGHHHFNAFRKLDAAGHVGGAEIELRTIVREERSVASTFFFRKNVDLGLEDRVTLDGAWLSDDLSTLDLILLKTTNEETYIVAGIYEREGEFLYNTAILLDRGGKLAGKYRKVMLPREEIERGLSPGSQLPVFTTDFGKLGILVCYDVFFAEPAKALAMQGAEVVAMPIWGGNEWLAKARSIEGRFYLLASGYDHPTYVQDPNGERLSEAKTNGSVAYAEVDLNAAHREKFLGDMRSRRMRETRLDLRMGPTVLTAK